MTISDNSHQRISSELKPGVFFSPGFYMGYWENCIVKNFSANTIISDVRLKQHREVWIGAIIAATQTLSGIQHFVGLPADEPPDVDVVKFPSTKTPLGREGTKIKRFHVEITRCNVDAGETILGQILKKNKPAYTGMSLVVYVYGDYQRIDFEPIHKALQEESVIYFDEINVLMLVGATGEINLLPSTYGFTRVYPSPGQTLVNMSDKVAFFREPDVVQGTGLGVATEWNDLGSYELLTPKLDKKSK